MSPETKVEVKNGITQSIVVWAKVLVFVAAVFTAGMAWNQNTADHDIIKLDLENEKARSTEVDKNVVGAIKEVKVELKNISDNQIKLMTNLGVE